jgi:hypothetical protein
MAEVKEVVNQEESTPVIVEAPKADPLVIRPDREFQLPNGKKLKMGKPPMPSHMLLPSLLASMMDPDRPTDRQKNELNARMCLFVRSINDRHINPPTSVAEVGVLMHDLGEDGCDIALEAYVTYFAPISIAQLEQVKK